jgi:hypothetical protein
MVLSHKIGGGEMRLLDAWFILKMTVRVFSESMAAERKRRDVQEIETRAHRGTYLCAGGAQRARTF